jgi:hypothetical protein
MDANVLKQLGIGDNVKLSDKDMDMLSKLLGSLGSGGKRPKMTASERNNLISKLSNFKDVEEAPKKDMKDMTEQEKQAHREELRKRLKSKQNEKKMMRTSNLQKKKTLDDPSNKFKDIINGITQEQNAQTTTETVVGGASANTVAATEAVEEDLSDFIN